LKDFDIPYRTNHRLVRGLDYYTRTTFEVLAGSLGAQDAVAGGGRYDGLVQALGGPDQPGIGFAVGVDRLRELLSSQQKVFETKPRLFVAALGHRAQTSAFRWVQELRKVGIATEMDFQDRSLKAQMRRANKLGASYVFIVGEQEMTQTRGVLRNLDTKEQEQIPLSDLVTRLVDRIDSRHENK
jgi:histidyl-tRNA synthetase